ncbi:hypothetical protein [Neorhizobium sp. P12A]|uniref:hypothetical protein n=1 Tax=Neorhizobium sp. P12A TaxID=2268027 RepID=UPI00165EA575|nr:hypothetical protein [Neorhizobium sp. P12A]
MASNVQSLPPLPDPKAPVVDPKTGLITVPWYQYLRQLDNHMRDAERRLTAGGL